MIEIKRDAYLQQLTMRKDNGMIKVITGIRRCGKSFLLFNIFKRYLQENGVDTDHIIEIALDGIENEELRDPKLCFKYIKDAMKDDDKYYLLLDEVQFMPRFEEVLTDVPKGRGSQQCVHNRMGARSTVWPSVPFRSPLLGESRD